MTNLIHESQPLMTYGAAVEEADTVVILLHGRGAMAHDMIKTAEKLPQGDIAYLAPQAANNVWYPNSGFGPLAINEPYLSSAMHMISNLIQKMTDTGIPMSNIFIGGFSQGACLASEYVGQHPRRYGGLFVLSGAIMGPLDRQHQYSGSLDGTPVYIGGVDHDTWVTPEQFKLTRDVLQALGAQVTLEIREGSEHTIRDAEIQQVSQMILNTTG